MLLAVRGVWFVCVVRCVLIVVYCVWFVALFAVCCYSLCVARCSCVVVCCS